jgi:hypothetical protein
MSAPFNVGDVVVCVDDRPTPAWGETGLKRGRMYRVSRVGPVMLNTLLQRDCHSVDVVGVVAPSRGRGFGDFRFRKIDDEVTESFRSQLKSLTKQKERT